MKPIIQEANRLAKWIALIIIVAMVVAILAPVFASACVAANHTTSIARLKDVGLALLTYANDSNGYLPPAANWTARVGLTDTGMKSIIPEGYCCLYVHKPQSPYCCALNRFVVGKKLDDLDPNEILVTEYRADRANAVTSSQPKLPDDNTFWLTMFVAAGQIRHSDYHKAVLSLTNDTPLEDEFAPSSPPKTGATADSDPERP